MDAFTDTKEERPGQGISDHDIDRVVLHERIALIYRLIAPTLIASVGPVVIFWWAIHHIFPGRSNGWLCATLAVTAARLVCVRAYNRSKVTPERAFFWGGMFFIGSLAYGLLWGYAGSFLFPAGPVGLQVLTAAMIIGVGAVGLSTLGTIRPLFISFFVAAVSPLVVRFFSFGSPDYVAAGLAGIIFMGLMIVNSSRISRNAIENISSRLKQARMAVEIRQTNNSSSGRRLKETGGRGSP